MKDLLIMVFAVIIVALIIRLNFFEKDVMADKLILGEKISIAEFKSMNLMDSINSITLKREREKQNYLTSLRNYQSKPAKERIKYIHLIDSTIVITDSTATLTETQIDSINRLRIAYIHTRMELSLCDTASKLKDTIITEKNNVITAQNGIISTQKKQARIAKLKHLAIGAGMGGVVVLLLF